MSDIGLVENVRQILEADIDELVDLSVASMGDAKFVSKWLIADEDKVALVSRGISIEVDRYDVQLRGSIQTSTDPEVNISGMQGYRIGYQRRWTLAATSPNSNVQAVTTRIASDGSSDVRVARINSSVAAFVDLSWRWHAMRPALLEDSYSDAFWEAAELFLARLPEFDEALADEDRYSWWRGLILGW